MSGNNTGKGEKASERFLSILQELQCGKFLTDIHIGLLHFWLDHAIEQHNKSTECVKTRL